MEAQHSLFSPQESSIPGDLGEVRAAWSADFFFRTDFFHVAAWLTRVGHPRASILTSTLEFC